MCCSLGLYESITGAVGIAGHQKDQYRSRISITNAIRHLHELDYVQSQSISLLHLHGIGVHYLHLPFTLIGLILMEEYEVSGDYRFG